jgi:hypothetical protein
VGGEPLPHEPVAGSWGPERGCVQVDGQIRIAPRKDLPAEPPGDLVQAGPLLVSRGRSLIDGGGSATLVHRGHLLNRPYSTQDQPAPESRPVVSALLFEQVRRP